MITINQIREDLREIRYYYSKQKVFDQASKTVIQSSVIDKRQVKSGNMTVEVQRQNNNY